ncbi:hypothetical protein [Virgisporangium aurantiacum]|uniref:TrbL/VirB6 plasmid conjugal transfer protein n=1 Tax=Virgisporangium aurantiacum TaxID=175570 RepID=A0A8J3ZC72_9ACTN|nr:hypothetical protein [Virgisporangium aurantiacum]GIJ61304.1 hypothetical protein Vau01_088200 [Virgisporangium aurantiacum]
MKHDRKPAGQAPLVRPIDAVDAAFLRRVVRTERRRARVGVVGWLARGGERARKRSRVWLRRTAGLVLILATVGGLLTVASPANAREIITNNFCNRKVFTPERADDGLVGEVLEAEYLTKINSGQIPKTKWAMYGVAGTHWNTFWLDCLGEEREHAFAASAVFWLSRNLSAIAILIFMWTFKGAVLDVFLSDDPTIAGTQATLDNMIERANIDIYLQLVAVATLIGATVIAWRWLAKRSGASEVFSKFGWMVVVAGLAGVYGGVPGGPGPQASSVLKTVNDWTNGITVVVLSAFTSTDCETPTIVYDARSSALDDAGRRRVRDLALECVAERMYEIMIYTPWAIGLLGQYNRAEKGPDGKRGEPTEDEKLAERILKQQAYSFTDIAANNAGATIRGVYYTGPHYVDVREFWDDDICALPEEARPPSSYSGKLCDRARMRQDVFGVEDTALEDAATTYDTVRPTKNANYWSHWSGGKSEQRFSTALTALVGSASISIIVIIVSIAYLILEVGAVMFALMAPLAFLFGLIPGFGVQVFLRWLELLLSTFLKRIVLGLFVGLLMSLYSVVFSMNMPWVMRLLIAAVIAMIGLVYRSRFVDAFSLNFSGGRDHQLDGELNGRVGAGLLTGAQFGANRAIRTTTWAWNRLRG